MIKLGLQEGETYEENRGLGGGERLKGEVNNGVGRVATIGGSVGLGGFKFGGKVPGMSGVWRD